MGEWEKPIHLVTSPSARMNAERARCGYALKYHKELALNQ